VGRMVGILGGWAVGERVSGQVNCVAQPCCWPILFLCIFNARLMQSQDKLFTEVSRFAVGQQRQDLMCHSSSLI